MSRKSDRPTSVLLPNGITVEQYTTSEGVEKCAVMGDARHAAALTRTMNSLGLPGNRIRKYRNGNGDDRAGGSGYVTEFLDLIAAVETIA